MLKGKVFTIKGGDGVERTLLQVKGEMNGKSGVFEYILDENSKVSINASSKVERSLDYLTRRF